jgi:hypothetical protein
MSDKVIDLNGFTGSEKLYKDQLGAVITEGVKYFAEEGKAFWAVSDMIVICKIHKLVRDNLFVKVIVSASNEKAAITYEDGNGVRLFKQEYDYASLPNGRWDFYFTDNTLMVTGEY